jgi:L-threonylcarbamoyladenylate synthase
MSTEIVRAEDVEIAGKKLAQGSVVVFPTETVYGMGASTCSPEAVRRVFSIKGRPPDNPLIVHISKMKQLEELWTGVPRTALKLASVFWPGPLTLVYYKKESVDKAVTGGLDTVSVRMPSNRIAMQLIETADVPVAAPSANLSGRPSITNFDDAVEELNGLVDIIIDGGKCTYGVESTVLDITGEVPRILRPGAVSRERIERVIGRVELHPAARGYSSAAEHLPSPGMRYRHYAPQHAKVYLFEGEEALKNMLRAKKELEVQGRVAIMVTAESNLSGPDVYIMGSSSHPLTISRRLFAMLRLIDRSGYNFILVQGIDERGIGLAVMNRLRRAATEINRGVSEKGLNI